MTNEFDTINTEVLNEPDIGSLMFEYDLSKIWLEWQVVQGEDDDLMSFDFKLIHKTIKPTANHKVTIPILALYHLAEKYNWLQVLRGPRHRPQDPYELVSFIQMLEGFHASD